MLSVEVPMQLEAVGKRYGVRQPWVVRDVAGVTSPSRGRVTGRPRGTAPVTALLRYQTAILLRSNRWIFPLIAYGVLILTGAAGGRPAGPQWLSLADGLDWSAAMLIPVLAFLTRSMLTAEPDASRACVAAATGPVRAQLAALLVALGGGVALAVAGICFEVLGNPAVAGAALRQANSSQTPHWPGAISVLGAAALLIVTWSASLLAAMRRDTRSASAA